MSVEFIGFIGNNNSSETTPRSGPLLDVTHIETLAKAHEISGTLLVVVRRFRRIPCCRAPTRSTLFAR